MPKTKTLDQLVAMKDKAVRFLQQVVGDPGKAEEFAAMTPEEYADHKRIKIENPSSGRIERRNASMAKRTMTKAELEDRVSELEDENQDLQDRLDSISDIITPEDSADEDEDEDDDDDEDEDESDEEDDDDRD